MLKFSRMMLILAGIGLVGCRVSNLESDPKASERQSLEGLTMHVVEVPTPPEVIAFLKQNVAPTASSTPGTDDTFTAMAEASLAVDPVVIEKVINTGKNIWNIVKKSQPVSNIKYDYANAIPKGLSSANGLAGFSDIQYRTYSVVFENLYKMKVMNGEYTVMHQYNGSYKGKGKYLANVGVVPVKWEMLIGFNSDFVVNKISTVNVGSAAAPIASLTMELSVDVKSFANTKHLTQVFQFRGDSATPRIVN